MRKLHGELTLSLEKVDRNWVKYQEFFEECGLVTLELPNCFNGEEPIPRHLTITIH